jgi:fructokinase
MDPGAERIIEDLTEFDVDVRFIRNDTDRRTPIVIERIRQVPGGIPRSRFVWTCPGCGTWLPSYHPVLAKDMVTVVASMPDLSVFFFDRVSRGALDLAEAAAKSGALIVFEPSGIGEERLFREALALSHILKYSHERLTGIGERLGNGAPLLEIETLGAEGLRYKFRGRSASKGWRLMDASPVKEVKDTVGAGDWCTAGVIHALGVKGVVGLMNANEGELEGALRLGQALAALTCIFEGARGGMYAMDKKQFRAATKNILDGVAPSSQGESPEVSPVKIWKEICPACGLKTIQANKSRR